MPTTPGARVVRCECGQVVARIRRGHLDYESPIRWTFEGGRLEILCFGCNNWMRLPTGQLKQAA